MRLAHVRRAAVTLAAGSAVLTATSAGFLAAAAAGAVAAAAATAGVSESCEALAPPAVSPSPSIAKTSAKPTPTPTKATTAPTTAKPTPTATATTPTTAPTTAKPTPTPTTPTATPTPTPTATVTPTTPATTASSAPATPTATQSSTASTAAAAGRSLVLAAASAARVSLCVGVSPLQRSRERGQAAHWAVAAWATGGNVPDAVIRLRVTPADGGTASFSFGCGADDGSSSCNLGAVDATSARRQFQAQVAIPETAADVTSVSLTATASAAGLRTDPAASASIAVIAPPDPVGATVSLPAATLPGALAPDPTLSPGGNASGLFPALSPGTTPSPGQSQATAARKAALATVLPGPANPDGAEAVGLAALALAFILAVTRVTVRRPAPTVGPVPGAAPSPEVPGAPEADGDQPADPSAPDPPDA